MTSPVLEVTDLRVDTLLGANVLADISFTLARGEVLGIAGESGCGKSTLGLALLGYSRAGLAISSGDVVIDGIDILSIPTEERRRARGRRIAYVSQDASKSLNPSIRVRDLILEVMRVHGTGSTDADVRQALGRVFLPTDAGFSKRFPHQLSGGQQQRLAIGVALACRPSVLVLDEPTTGLDVVTQAHILDEVRRICRDEQVACVFISHDLAAMSVVATRIAILYAGRFVEERAALELLTMPRHPYSAGLVGSVPVHARPEVLPGIAGMAVGISERPPGCAFAPRCALRTDECDAAMPELRTVGDGHRVRCLHWEHTTTAERAPRTITPLPSAPMLLEVRSLRAEHGRGVRTVVAADGVTFGIAASECVALVGESGSGKSTIARCVAGLHQPVAGEILLSGVPLDGSARNRSPAVRQQVQIVFQNPYDSLNPLQTVEDALLRPLQLFLGLGKREARQRVPALMEQVRLPRRLLTRYPRELSGGERQRVAIARALAAGPELLICDEVTSALDVSVQAAILSLLSDLDIAMLFITHDLGVVASIADRVLVLERGVVREEGSVVNVLQTPTVEYSQRLIDAIPQIPVAPIGEH